MIFQLVFIFILTLGGCAEKSEKCDNGVFQEENGIVLIEAESINLTDGWSLENDVEGYTGNGYITWKHSTVIETNDQGLLSYKFNISKPGNYTLKIRNYHSCEDFTECNDVFVKMDDGQWRKNFNHTLSEWDWNSQQDIDHVFSDSEFYLDDGEHTLHLSGRSQNFSIDKMALFHGNTPKDVYKEASLSTCITN